MLSTLLDSCALDALFDPSAKKHQHFRSGLPTSGVLLTTGPCVAEALHILPRVAMKIALLRWIGAKAVSVHDFQADDVGLMIERIQHYSERRAMDFADASLVWLADW